VADGDGLRRITGFGGIHGLHRTSSEEKKTWSICSCIFRLHRMHGVHYVAYCD